MTIADEEHPNTSTETLHFSGVEADDDERLRGTAPTTRTNPLRPEVGLPDLFS